MICHSSAGCFIPNSVICFFIGLLQPLGAIMPLAELQSEWIADYLIGDYALPAVAEMQQAINRDREAMRKRYGNAPRHTMQVDFAPYVAHGQERAQSRVGTSPEITKRAATRNYCHS